MPTTEPVHDSGGAPTAILTVHLMTVIAAVFLGFCALSAYVVIEMRRAAWERAAEIANSLAVAIESDVSRNFETLNLSLQAVVENLKHPDINRIPLDLQRHVLFNRSATAKHLGAILVLGEAGDVILDSRTIRPPSRNLADRDYFQVHKNDPALGMYIGQPYLTRGTGAWFIGVSRRLSREDGSFSGVVVASLRLSYFQQLFSDAALGPNSNITLAKSDGIALMRWPYKEEFLGRNLSNAKLYQYLPHSRTGRFETFAVTDGVHRLVVYRQIGDLPLVIGIGQSTQDIYRNWRATALLIGAVLVVLCASAVFFGVLLFRELRRREDAESKYAKLALCDELTGLANRRHFNEALDREWRRCMRDKKPIALMMLDADSFKSYNDARGHQEGDALLQTIAKAIASIAQRGGDFGARYGGDEFVVLLPGASQAQAKTIAEKLRQRFAQFCKRDRVVESGLSIGIAEAAPRAGVHAGELFRAADQALYRAKRFGRNRTETTSVDLADLLAPSTPTRDQAA